MLPGMVLVILQLNAKTRAVSKVATVLRGKINKVFFYLYTPFWQPLTDRLIACTSGSFIHIISGFFVKKRSIEHITMSPKMINYKLWQTFRVSVNFWLKVGENSYPYTGWCICIWTISRGCLEVTGWLKIKNFNSSKKFMQIPLKVNKVYFLTSSMASQWPFEIFLQKVKTYAIPIYGLQYP